MRDVVADYLAGVVAGTANIISGYPFDTVKVRLQSVEGAQYRGPVHCTSSILRNEGVRGLFRGVTSPLVGGALETGLNYMLFERALAWIQGAKQQGPTAPTEVFAAGALAGVGIAFVLTPIELVKCRLQTDTAGRYQNSLACLRLIVHEDGARGLQRGLSGTIAREFVGNGLYFSSYAYLKGQLTRTDGENTRSRQFAVAVLSGGLAGMISWSFMLPFDVLKTNMQVHHGSYESLWRAAMLVWRQRGLRGFYAGLGTTLVRAFPANACQWVGWELAITQLRGLENLHVQPN